MAARKRATAPTQDTVSINDACLRLGLAEQSLRLALSDIRPDDFDTVKAVSEADLEAIAFHFQPQLPETSPQQEIEPSTEQQQNALSLPQEQQQLSTNTQSPIPNTQLTLIDQLARQASEEIAAVDAIAQVKNQLILNNLAVRDAELAEGINQHWQHQKQGYLGAIRDLASLAKESVAITPDTTDLPAEVDQIIAELAKKLTA
ncbi:MAG: hypothetical protein RM368_36595 [Nostoc sp. DedSLP03]|uniref:hypothetical protein n=1 Tax=Nostoc sp. DedSLP03 TaxID=3075400 RepID=UPI002AD3482E|nr:hypothetical protein [Nostoc sp. DedSLP03]MDZ7970390.1 hypothetical protein [Nostoc sp. DedSLP03]